MTNLALLPAPPNQWGLGAVPTHAEKRPLQRPITPRFREMSFVRPFAAAENAFMKYAGYALGSHCRDRKLRFAPPEIIIGNAALLLAIEAACRLKHTVFSLVLSYSEAAEAIGLAQLRSHAEEVFDARTGGLEHARGPCIAILHRRRQGCDVHLFAVPLNLETGLCLPLFAREKIGIALSEKVVRRINLRDGPSDFSDAERANLIARPPRNLAPEQVDGTTSSTRRCL